jgi:hypothetical protein
MGCAGVTEYLGVITLTRKDMHFGKVLGELFRGAGAWGVIVRLVYSAGSGVLLRCGFTDLTGLSSAH